MLTPPKRIIPLPQSCDTFVFVQASSSKGVGTLFGKNSVRPSNEEHEVIRIPHSQYEQNEVVQCTYISVPQASETLDCILSRPSWLWGCEMGANECGVVGGNEAIQTLLADELISNDGTPTKSLLGMDILRLALERGTSAKHAVDICIHFLETYGQGGPCSTDDQDWTYENSFLFADSNEAYVLETAGSRHWAYEHIKKGEYRNISNGISIRSNCTVSKDIQSICKQNGWWDGTSVFDWKKAVGTGGSVEGLESCGGREASGLKHLKAIKAEADKMQSPPTPRYWVDAMANNILRDESSGICFRDRHGFCSTGSQISWLVPSKSKEEDYHFFTGASDPLFGTPYKLFQFSNQVKEQQTDHDTTVLWNTWRKRALVRKEMNSAQRDALLSIEEEAFSYLEHDKEKNVNHHSTFSEVVQREIIELLKDS